MKHDTSLKFMNWVWLQLMQRSGASSWCTVQTGRKLEVMTHVEKVVKMKKHFIAFWNYTKFTKKTKTEARAER